MKNEDKIRLSQSFVVGRIRDFLDVNISDKYGMAELEFFEYIPALA